MQYEGAVFRPPSEAYSLIVQATIGCAHNQCTFCGMYKNEKFRVRGTEEVIADLRRARTYYQTVERIFLADGDALCLSFAKLKEILLAIKAIFPECRRVGIYAAPRDILGKTMEELQALRDLGLGMMYMGLETGSDQLLQAINKGVTAAEMVAAGQQAVASGIELSVTVISGLGGKARWREHAIETGQALSQIDPQYLGLLTLMLVEGTPMKAQIDRGEPALLSPEEVMQETKLMLEHTEVTDCLFRSNHASNYVSLRGSLPRDRAALINGIQTILERGYDYKGEAFRGL